MKLPEYLRAVLLCHACRVMIDRDPDFVIGDPRMPYMERWFLLPRNRWFNIYLHRILRSDDDRALHDHPAWNLSLILDGAYWEYTPRRLFRRAIGEIVFRRADALHRLEIDPRTGEALTLWISGPKRRVWGFACPQGWVPWHKFVDAENPGAVGRGCDQ